MIINKLTEKIEEIAERIKTVREDCGLSDKDVAAMTDMDLEDYQALEEGRSDITFSFIYKFARICNIEITAIIDGHTPKLADYTLTRRDEGMMIHGKHGVTYEHLAPMFRNRMTEPFLVTIPYSEESLSKPRKMVIHRGQELNIVVKGTMKKIIGDSIEVLHEGDSIYHDSSIPHDEIALGGEDLVFYAFVMDPDKSGLASMKRLAKTSNVTNVDAAISNGTLKNPIYDKWINTTIDSEGVLNGISFKNEDKFNFAFDVVDEMARTKPDRRAMLYVSNDFKDRIFTFRDFSRYSSMTANYFESLGIKKGDKVMLVLKRHYQFWFSILALHKIGAIAIPATNLLMDHDYEYRFKAAGVKAIICTGDGIVSDEIDKAAKNTGSELIKVMVNNDKEGWHSFNKEFVKFSDIYERKPDSACGNDPMCMFFTSGTTGNPKITVHSFKYPLGHFITAKYWHNVVPDGLHFTMADTGWAKALWGKIYGQWLCEAGIFVFDFDKFNASDVLPMFAKYNITTFCAPPTIYRFFIKDDLTRYDLSSIRYSTIAGEALNPEVYSQWLKATGVNLNEAFGQTESTVICGNLVGQTIIRGSMGKPSPLYKVDIVDPDGNPVKDGETGEIVVDVSNGAPCGLFTGYYNDQEKTNEVWHDGLYHTGDTAWRDNEGYYWYVGRIDDVIKSSGYRIGPFEIESVIMELPYVLECAVTGAPDPIRGQVVKANIVLVPGTEKTEELKKEIQNYVKKTTAPYKYPRIVEFFDEFPKTTSGKIRRSELRKMSQGK